MGFYSGQVITVKGEKYEVLRADTLYNLLTCKRFNSIETKLFDFSFEEVAGN